MTTDQIKERLLELVSEVNSLSGDNEDRLVFHQQDKTKGNISVKMAAGSGRIYVQPSSIGCDVSLSGKDLERKMYPFMRNLFERDCHGFKQRNRNRGWDRQPFWRTDDFQKVRKVVFNYAGIPFSEIPTDDGMFRNA